MKKPSAFHRIFAAAFVVAAIHCSLIPAQAAAGKLDLKKLEGMKARSVGPAGMSGRVTTVDVVLSNTDVIYLGTASGGMWKSTDGGVVWTPIFDDQPTTSIGALAIDQRNPDVIWAGSGEGNPRNSQTSGTGLYKSVDGGRTWKRLGFENSRNIHRVIIHPRDSDIVYVGVQGSAWGEHGGRGVWKTVDGGRSWQHVLKGDEKTGIADLVIDPRNPEKLIAAMWEFRRWPWFFKSGGKGSGLFVTFDGGQTWDRRTSEDGLPKGELGRMGVAIARSKPEVVYALVEAKKNGLYRSDDGGFKWRLINDQNNVNPRPFYYADIRIDPSNENRLFALHSRLTMSEDGGKTFRNISGGIHPDHHELWIHPDNPQHMINGNDGGAAITRNGGKTWRFVKNLPLGQFYHIRVDNQTPYNICGGLQDNGSWCGPSYIAGGGTIRNYHWQSVGGGDGFDVLPDPLNPDYGYSMSQGGNLGRYNRATGARTSIRPAGPDGERLRFNWSAGLAIDPHDRKTIFYGSQYLHKSSDYGRTWEIISPDLTTNDPEKQRQIDSGGLTYDVTNAENYTTIVAVAPSPKDRNVIWVGTDDGKVQVTRDGGKNWFDATSNIPDAPLGTWVPHIHPSDHNAAEAFVVMEDHRRNNWEPYLMHSADYGRTWRNLVSEDSVEGYALSVVQDPVEPRLIFLGTEMGLYFSIDAGQSWNRWTNGFPTNSTMDLAIQPQEHDLVIGTFGRSIYVIDDIRPLRELARKGPELLTAKAHIFQPPDAVQYLSAAREGASFPGQSDYRGEGRSRGAVITYVVNRPPRGEGGEGEESMSDARQDRMQRIRDRFGDQAAGRMARMGNRDSVRIEVLDKEGNVVRRIQGPAKPGINRVTWDMRKEQPQTEAERERAARRTPAGAGGGRFRALGRAGMLAWPGEYTVRMRVGGEEATTQMTLKPDPRREFTQEGMDARVRFVERGQKSMQVGQRATRQLSKAKEDIDRILSRIPRRRGDRGLRDLRQQGQDLKKRVEELEEMFSGRRNVQGIRRDPNTVMGGFFRVSRQGDWEAPTANEKTFLRQAEARLQKGLGEVNSFFSKDFAAFRKAVEKADIPLFDKYETFTLPGDATPQNRRR